MDNKSDIITAIEYLTNGKLQNAELLFAKILSEESGNYDAMLGLAFIKVYMADYQEALPLLGDAIRIKPNVARIQFLMALVLAKLHRVDEAEEFLMNAIELDPQDERIPRVKAAILIEKGDFDEALKELKMYILEHPDEPWDVWNDLGTIYYSFGQHKLAQDAFNEAVKSAESMGISIPFVHFNMGLCCNSRGNDDEAKGYFSKALELDPEIAPAWAALGLMIAKETDYCRAIDFISKAIDLEPFEPSHWYAMSQIMELMGDSAAAEHYANEGYKALRKLYPDANIPDGTAG